MHAHHAGAGGAGHKHVLKHEAGLDLTLNPTELCMRSMQVLVELAMEREEDIPALIYEARPVARPWCHRLHRSDRAFKCGLHAHAVVIQQHHTIFQ